MGAHTRSYRWKGAAVLTDRPDAQLSFNFPGDSLTVALLYRGDGTNAQLTLDNGTSYPLQVSAAEATATAPTANKQQLQKKLFHLNGLSCTNHTATLSRNANDLPGTGKEVQFDWYSFVTPDSTASCTVTGSPSISSGSTSLPPHLHPPPLDQEPTTTITPTFMQVSASALLLADSSSPSSASSVIVDRAVAPEILQLNFNPTELPPSPHTHRQRRYTLLHASRHVSTLFL